MQCDFFRTPFGEKFPDNNSSSDPGASIEFLIDFRPKNPIKYNNCGFLTGINGRAAAFE